MLVVSDNSPLNILIRIRQAHILPALFNRIVVPPQIVDEMTHPDAPAEVRQFAQAPPEWLHITAPSRLLRFPGLDLGERAAMSLAVESEADLLLVDEQQARRVALSCGLNIIGAVGVLERAADSGLVADLAAVHDAIRRTDFHVSNEILEQSLAMHLKRRHGK